MARERERNLTNVMVAQVKSQANAIKKQIAKIDFSKFKAYDFNATATSNRGNCFCDIADDMGGGCDGACDARW